LSDRRKLEEGDMLWTVVLILFALWLAGTVSSTTFGGLIPLLLVLAVIVVVFNLISGRRTV
jgi:hypothetical protein